MANPPTEHTRPGPLRTTARWRTAPIPDGYGTRPFTGKTGRVVLPIHLDWSTTNVERNLDTAAGRRRVYEIVLRVGDATDVETYVNPQLLIEAWPIMTKPLAVRETWEAWIEQRTAS